MLVLDSNEQLPPGWADLQLEDIVKSVLPDTAMTDGLSDGGSSDCQSDDADGIPESLNEMAQLHQSLLDLNDSLNGNK